MYSVYFTVQHTSQQYIIRAAKIKGQVAVSRHHIARMSLVRTYMYVCILGYRLVRPGTKGGRFFPASAVLMDANAAQQRPLLCGNWE